MGPAGSVACNAPFSSMYLDQHGFVRACCMNDYQLLGNVTATSLRDIWLGEPADELRRAMEAHDLTVGCEFCKWQVDEGRSDLAFSKWFSEYPVTDPEPAWPQQLELSISNNCNLQCIMCNGEWSSSIRSHREHRPPLPKVYDGAFFEDLREFIPHLRRIKFLGGEPFLASETLRVMDLLVEMEANVRCHVTTNGTQWSPRVERIMDMLPIDVAVSLDASSKETYERIRIGSDWDEVQTNLDRFQERARRRNTDVTVTFCLMAVNWRDFAGFCEMADARGIGCAVNTVTEPAHLSLYRLPTDEFEVMLAELERIEAERGATFGRSRATWLGELDRLRQHAEQKRRSAWPVTGLDLRRVNPEFPRPFAGGEAAATATQVDLLAPSAAAVEAVEAGGAGFPDDPPGPYLIIDSNELVAAVEGADELVGIPADAFLGRALAELMEFVCGRHGEVVKLDTLEMSEHRQVFEVEFSGGGRAVSVLVPARYGAQAAPGRLYLNWAT